VYRDKYRNFTDLSREERHGVDYRICVIPCNTDVAIIAPHGGKIERGTSEIAAAIAADAHSLYRSPALKRAGNRGLHITSTNFDEPNCLELISMCKCVVAVHGCKGNEKAVELGGLANGLRDAIGKQLTAAGFEVKVVATGSLAGQTPCNICNRGRDEAGVQLEITKALRDSLLQRPQDMANFAAAVRQAIADN